MEVGKVVKYEDYLTLLWWSAIGFRQIKDGGLPKETAEKYLEGIEKLIGYVDVVDLKKTKKKCRKT